MIQLMISEALRQKDGIFDKWKADLNRRGEAEFLPFLARTGELDQLFQAVFHYFTDFQSIRTEQLDEQLVRLLKENWPPVFLNMALQSFRNAIAETMVDGSTEELDLPIFFKTLNEWMDAVINLISHRAAESRNP
ncbi:hypothetical protein [Metabacillus sp. 84]|uniref:hypothetical protein n=1 Tax=Metabacillus sp. 84 TaxID=3404705 RepID=UPI003CE86699